MRDDANDDIVASIDESECPQGLVPGARMWAMWDPAIAQLLPPHKVGA